MDLIDVVLYTLLAYGIGNFLIAWLDTKQIHRDVNKQQLVNVLDRMIREVKIENHHGAAYWFDKENDRFLAQGSTTQEIVSVLKTRFPNNVFLLPSGQVVSAPNWQVTDKAETMITQDMVDRFNK